MAIDRKTFVVVNPNSANGSTRRQWPEMEERIRDRIGPFEWKFTAGPGDATLIARNAIEQGFEQIVTVGGDGSNNEVVNGFFDGKAQINPQCAFSFICRGTGGDFRKTFGWSTELDEAIARIASDDVHEIDLGRFSYMTHDDREALSYFINITSFGIGGLVDQYVNNSSKALGGRLSFFIGSFKALMAYKNKPIRLKVDDTFDQEVIANNVAIANGRFFGGGMHIAPEAIIDDGLFDVVILGDLSKMQVLTGASTIYKGTHLENPKNQHMRGRVIIAESDEEVLIDMDGEAPGKLPCHFENLNRILPLKV